jgi:hypothetical protein
MEPIFHLFGRQLLTMVLIDPGTLNDGSSLQNDHVPLPAVNLIPDQDVTPKAIGLRIRQVKRIQKPPRDSVYQERSTFDHG